MLNTIAPFWDGNQTWLVVIGASLFAAFPVVYAVFLGAFYIPVLLLLVGLIFRGIAFEFRGRAKQMLWLWDRGFFLGSTVVAFVQGAAVGAMMRGIPVVDGQFAGNALDWVHPFPIFTGLGMVLGYALLGAGWLVFKSEGALRDWAYARIPMAGDRRDRRAGPGFHRRGDVRCRRHRAEQSTGTQLGTRLPDPRNRRVARRCSPVRTHGAMACRSPMTTLFFIAAYLTLGVMFWPYMIPYTVTVANAASPDASLQFLFYCGVVVLPVIVVYTFAVYRVFRGKSHERYR